MGIYTCILIFVLFSAVNGQYSVESSRNLAASNQKTISSGQSRIGCVRNDFENGLEDFNYNASVCANFPKWIIGNYSTISIESPDLASETFISPSSDFRCISSTPFQASGGTIEINVFMEGESSSDFLQALLMKNSDGNDLTVAMASVSPSLVDVNGWYTLKMAIPEYIEDFEAYIVFLGSKSEDSIFLVDSYRYISNTIADSSCLIYESETDATSPNCVTYNFEQDFDIEFSRENVLCDGYTPWSLNNYTTSITDGPDDRSTLFISPNEAFSCIASSVFRMEPNGVIEATVFMEPKSSLDHIIVIAQKMTSQDVDTVVGFTMYYPVDRVFTAGWNVLSFPVVDFSSFDGYLILFGKSSEGSIVLVDSIRYIPPSLSPTDVSCALY